MPHLVGVAYSSMQNGMPIWGVGGRIKMPAAIPASLGRSYCGMAWLRLPERWLASVCNASDDDASDGQTIIMSHPIPPLWQLHASRTAGLLLAAHAWIAVQLWRAQLAGRRCVMWIWMLRGVCMCVWTAVCLHWSCASAVVRATYTATKAVCQHS